MQIKQMDTMDDDVMMEDVKLDSVVPPQEAQSHEIHDLDVASPSSPRAKRMKHSSSYEEDVVMATRDPNQAQGVQRGCALLELYFLGINFTEKGVYDRITVKGQYDADDCAHVIFKGDMTDAFLFRSDKFHLTGPRKRCFSADEILIIEVDNLGEKSELTWAPETPLTKYDPYGVSHGLHYLKSCSGYDLCVKYCIYKHAREAIVRVWLVDENDGELIKGTISAGDNGYVINKSSVMLFRESELHNGRKLDRGGEIPLMRSIVCVPLHWSSFYVCITLYKGNEQLTNGVAVFKQPSKRGGSTQAATSTSDPSNCKVRVEVTWKCCDPNGEDNLESLEGVVDGSESVDKLPEWWEQGFSKILDVSHPYYKPKPPRARVIETLPEEVHNYLLLDNFDPPILPDELASKYGLDQTRTVGASLWATSMAEIFEVCNVSSGRLEGSFFHGTIKVKDRVGELTLYKRESEQKEYVVVGHPLCHLSSPDRCIVANKPFSIHVDLNAEEENGQTRIGYHHEIEGPSAPSSIYEEQLTSAEIGTEASGMVRVKYMVFAYAYQANVMVSLLQGVAPPPPPSAGVNIINGTIIARYSLPQYNGDDLKVKLFDSHQIEKQAVEAKFGELISLQRSVVVVPTDSKLIVDVDLCLGNPCSYFKGTVQFVPVFLDLRQERIITSNIGNQIKVVIAWIDWANYPDKA